MLIKNLKTGVVSECSNKDVIAQCMKDTDYEVMEAQETKKEPVKRTTKK